MKVLPLLRFNFKPNFYQNAKLKCSSHYLRSGTSQEKSKTRNSGRPVVEHSVVIYNAKQEKLDHAVLLVKGFLFERK